MRVILLCQTSMFLSHTLHRGLIMEFYQAHIWWIFSEEDKCMFASNVTENFEFEVIDSMNATYFRQANFNSIFRNSIEKILDLIFVDEIKLLISQV